jgi:hypothetical protein
MLCKRLSQRPGVCCNVHSALDLYKNALRGGVPTSIGALTALTMLRLEENSLQGSLPLALSQLAALRYVR